MLLHDLYIPFSYSRSVHSHLIVCDWIERHLSFTTLKLLDSFFCWPNLDEMNKKILGKFLQKNQRKFFLTKFTSSAGREGYLAKFMVIALLTAHMPHRSQWTFPMWLRFMLFFWFSVLFQYSSLSCFIHISFPHAYNVNVWCWEKWLPRYTLASFFLWDSSFYYQISKFKSSFLCYKFCCTLLALFYVCTFLLFYVYGFVLSCNSQSLFTFFYCPFNEI